MQPEDIAHLAEALSRMDETEGNWAAAEAHRLHGELLLQQSGDDTVQASACFTRAIEIARLQGARSLELRAAVSLSQLWRQQDKLREAVELLEPIYNGFTEGFDTPDLQAANRCLDELT